MAIIQRRKCHEDSMAHYVFCVLSGVYAVADNGNVR